MAGRGRRQGYGNYSLQEQLLLCEVTEKIMPLGSFMWERVATTYNAKRPRNAPERDFESLRRKFKNLFKKPKPTGSGDVPPSLRPIMWSKEIQAKIEAEGGAHTSHDGLDEGEDDEALVQEVEQATNSSAGLSRVKRKVYISQQGDISSLSNDDSLDSESDQGEVSSIINDEVATQPQPIGTTRECDDAISQYAQRSDPSTPNTQQHGTIMTVNAPIDVRSTDNGCLSDADEINNDSQGVEDAHAVGDAQMNCPPQRTAGRPRSARREPIQTVATPDGPALRRDPMRALGDAREIEENQNLGVASNRLGGQDLRVFRDNFDTMTRTILNENGKRPGTDGSRTDGSSSNSSYAKTRRKRAKQRLDNMQRELEETERKQASTGNDMMRILLMLQKESDRRAEDEAMRRREEREERVELERRDRAEREQIRREEAEDKRRREDAREARLELEKERLALDRAEARQRHEQMMAFLSNLQKK